MWKLKLPKRLHREDERLFNIVLDAALGSLFRPLDTQLHSFLHVAEGQSRPPVVLLLHVKRMNSVKAIIIHQSLQILPQKKKATSAFGRKVFIQSCSVFPFPKIWICILSKWLHIIFLHFILCTLYKLVFHSVVNLRY